MGGGKSGGSQPAPIDPGQSAGEFLFGKSFQNYGGITDPALQERLLSAESTYRPQYTALELGNQEQFLFGTDGNAQYERMQAELAGLRAGAEVSGADTPDRRSALAEQAEVLFPSVKPNPRGGRGNSFRNQNREIDARRQAYIDAALKDPGSNERAARIAELETQMASMDPDASQSGLLDILARATPEISQIQSDAASIQRERDIADVTKLLPEVMQAQREADPAQYELYDSLMGQAQQEVDAGGRLSFDEQRMAEQQVREGSAARGRGRDNVSVFEEALNRQQFQDARENRARGFGQSMLQAGELVNADPFLTILGRPSGASQMAQGQQLMGNDMMNNLGPALFDPNTGINMAMANQTNQANYGAAQQGAAGARSGGMMAAGGALGGAAIVAI